jgi:peptidoglycan/xylan/chitin deacetylase (PgdA/CDA1 family)
MRAAIVGGIIAIITLAAYGIVQAGRWAPAAQQARIETPAPVAVEAAPAVATEVASTAPAEPSETAAAGSADAPVEMAANAPADAAEVVPSDAAPSDTTAPSSDTVADAALPAVVSPPVAPATAAPVVAAAAPVAPAPVASPAAAPVAAPVMAAAVPPAAVAPTPAPASKPMVVAQYQPAPIAPAIRPAGATPAAATQPAPAPAPVAAPQPVAAPAPAPPPLKAPDIVCNNPNAMKVSRVVEIDTTGGPGFGSQHFKTMDFLRDHEIVLTFDDGPWLNNTPAVLKALADQCLRATFFNIGKHASYYPEILKQVLAAGHTVGTHTWSHADLSKAKTPDDAKEEIEKGFSAVHYYAQGAGQIAPFFRFPDLRHPPEMLTYLGERNIASFSTDIDSFDFKIHKPDQLTKSLIAKVNKQGKGIILMHDFQKGTAAALPEILAQLKAGGFKIVHMVPKEAVKTIPQYDEAMIKDQKLPTVSQRPTSSVVKTISEVPGEAKQ